MNILPREEIHALIHAQEKPCISIYLSIPPSAADPSRQLQIRLKNAIRESESSLFSYGMEEKGIQLLIKPLKDLVTTAAFMDGTTSSLAVFLAPGFMKYFWLPQETREMVNLSERFHVKPLLNLFSGSSQYYLLAFSRKKVRFFKGSRYALTEVEAAGFPNGIKDALNYDSREKTLQRIPGKSPGRGGKSGMSHGHGAGYDLLQEDLEKYFRIVDKKLAALLKDQKDPLLLAAVDEEIVLFNRITSYSHTLEKGISGNPDGLSSHELHVLSWEIMEPVFEKEYAGIRDQYREKEGSGLTETDLLKILPASSSGQVQSVFVARDLQKWGIFDPGSLSLEIHNSKMPGDQDLLDLVAYYTLINGGDVFVKDPESIPGGSTVAALMRYL